jgi:hypothetical protein
LGGQRGPSLRPRKLAPDARCGGPKEGRHARGTPVEDGAGHRAGAGPLG